MRHTIGQKTDATARKQVDGKCRCVCCKGDLLQQLTTNRVGYPINKCLHARKTEKLEGVPHTELCTSALLIPGATLDPKELNSVVTTEKEAISLTVRAGRPRCFFSRLLISKPQ